MSERTQGLRSVLSVPAIYELAQVSVGARRSRRRLADRHIRARPGHRVLDIGCGPGDLIEVLPEVDYLGFDVNKRYVESARRRHGDRGRFLHADARDVDLGDERGFDVAVAVGILHHLDDASVGRLLRFAAAALVPGGRLVTFDGVLTPGQPRVARWLIERDRGQCVRTVDGYERLAREVFEEVDTTVADDFLRVPFTHIVMEATRPR